MQDSAFLDVDRHGVLRVPGILWLGFAVMARYWILVVIVTASARRSQQSVLLLATMARPLGARSLAPRPRHRREIGRAHV